MKSFLPFISTLMIIMLFALGCGPEETSVPSPRPQANFSHNLPGRPPFVKAGGMVSYTDLSTGPIESWAWQFDNGNISSSEQNPQVRMENDGIRNMELVVTGPGGTSRGAGYVIVVGGMDADCNNVNTPRTHFTDNIRDLRSRGLVRAGNVRILNDYDGQTIRLALYDPVDWLAGRYNQFTYWDVPPGESTLGASGGHFNGSNEWGVRVSFTSGTQSCIRTLGSSANFDAGYYNVRASSIVN